jgi:hypothetical protein
MESFVCLLCDDWVGTPEPYLVPSGGAGGLEFLSLQRGGIKPLLYALEIVMDGTKLVRVGNFETEHRAAGVGILFHNALLTEGQICHCRVRPVRDYFGADVDADLTVGRNQNFVPAEP